MVLPLAGGSSTRRVPYSLNPQLRWESAKLFLLTLSGTRIRCQKSFPNSSELRCNFNWTSSPMESRARASAGVWRYSIITPAKRRCTWVAEARNHSVAWKIGRYGLTKSPNGHDNERKRPQSAGARRDSALLAQSSLTLSTFARARNNRVAMHESLCVYRTAYSPSRTGINHSLTWAATIRRRDLTHSLSLSLVASCHR